MCLQLVLVREKDVVLREEFAELGAVGRTGWEFWKRELNEGVMGGCKQPMRMLMELLPHRG